MCVLRVYSLGALLVVFIPGGGTKPYLNGVEDRRVRKVGSGNISSPCRVSVESRNLWTCPFQNF